MKKIAGMVLASGLLVSSLSGCSKITANELRNISTQNMLTVQEVLDFREEGLKYGNIATRPAVKDYKLSYNEVDEDTKKKINDKFNEIQTEHNKLTDYKLSESLHDYFKNFADDMVLTLRPAESTIKESMGYYYLTVNYDATTNSAGNFKSEANYLGIDGIIVKDYLGIDTIQSAFLGEAIRKVNEYRVALEKEPLPNLASNEVFNTQQPEADTPTQDQQEIQYDENGNPIETEPVTGETQVPETKPVTTSVENDGVSLDGNIRKLAFDIDEFNEVVGSSKEQIAYMPNVNMVYSGVTPQGSMSGFGMYQEGINGLKEFGFDRTKSSGLLTLTYVFKQNELNGEMDYIFPYVETYVNNNEFFAQERKSLTVPAFINTELKKTLDEFDRATNNKDLTELMSGDVIEDAGLGLKMATYGRATDMITFISELKAIEGRDNNVYLLKVERTVEEEPASHGTVSQYRDTYYMVLRQKDLKFRVNDVVLAKRELTKQPELNPDGATYRRLVALNLEGEVTEDVKNEITSTVLKKWQDSCTQRNLGTDEGATFGMYTCFNNDRSLLSDKRLEYINSKMRNILTAQGVEVPGNVTIKVNEWVGGYDTQVEFTTKEFVDYEGTNKGTYLECYYLVSHYGTEWVIDDIEVMTETPVEGDEYNKIKAEFNN